MKQPNPTGPLAAAANVQASKAAQQRGASGADALPKPELPDFRAISRDALAASLLAALEQNSASTRIDERAAALLALEVGPVTTPLSAAGGAATTAHRDKHGSPSRTSADRDDTQASELAASGPNAGQLMAAAHTVAAYLSAGSAAILDAAVGTLTPRAAETLSIRIAYLTPEGGHAAIGLAHPDLGELGIEVSLNARALSVIATAETERSAAAIREGQAVLAKKLAAQDIELQSLTVVVVNRRQNDRHSRNKKRES